MMQGNRSKLVLASAIVALVAAIGCDEDLPTAPTEPGPEGAVVTITASGVSPKTATITAGQSVTFVNNDSSVHEIVSGPVPSYDDCPAINRVGRLQPGASVQTGALTSARSCGFLDLMQINEERWQGTITVQ